MASTSSVSSALSISSSSSSSSTLVDAKPPLSSTTQCVSLPSLPPPSKASFAYCRKIARNVLTRTTARDAPAATEIAETELPDIFKTVQEAWDKLEDKYAVSSLAVAGAVALWGSAGMISAIDRLPLVPGALELVGIGYTGWFAYKNLVFKPEREALFSKIKETYKDIIGSS